MRSLHVPTHMSCEALDRGYAWCYDTLFSHRSIWKRRPDDARAGHCVSPGV